MFAKLYVATVTIASQVDSIPPPKVHSQTKGQTFTICKASKDFEYTLCCPFYARFQYYLGTQYVISIGLTLMETAQQPALPFIVQFKMIIQYKN